MTPLVRRRVAVWIADLAIFTGLALLAWCGISLYRAHAFQVRQTAALNHEMLSAVRKATAPALPAAPSRGALLGSLSIPRVGISSVIVEGSDDRTLAMSVGHIPGTALPGDRSGNIALAGHRDTFFRGLRNIKTGDGILITTPTGTKLYKVESTRVVPPQDVQVLRDVGKPLLTLVTCYPFNYIGAAPNRFIVQARPESGS